MAAIEREIMEALGTIPGIDTVLLFGSRACGKARPDSDLDIAVLPATDVPGGRRKLQSCIAVALAHLAPEGRVDVVLLDEVPELLRQRVFESGKVLIRGDPIRFRELRIRTMREHGDREPYRRLLIDAQARRLTAGMGSDRG
jgi:predicted nucleotidyltransferase